MSEQWKRWECPACRVVHEDPAYSIYATSCANGHMVILGHPSVGELDVWASLDDHFYSAQEIRQLLQESR